MRSRKVQEIPTLGRPLAGFAGKLVPVLSEIPTNVVTGPVSTGYQPPAL